MLLSPSIISTSKFYPQPAGLASPNPDFADVELLVGFDSGINDESNNAFVGTDASATGNRDLAVSKFGAASWFESTPSTTTRVHWGNNLATTLLSTETWTMEAWLRGPDPFVSNDSIAHFNLFVSGVEFLSIYIGALAQSRQYLATSRKDAVINNVISSVVAANQFDHIALSNDGGTGTMTFFVNGVNEGTAACANTSWSATPEVRCGSNLNAGTPSNDDSWTDEIRISRNFHYPTEGFTAPLAKFPRS